MSKKMDAEYFVIDQMKPIKAPGRMWGEFFDAHGPVVMMQAFGWPEPEKRRRHGERIFAFYAAGERVGWASLLPAASGSPEWYMSRGVWPAYQGRGHAARIGDLMADFAFKQLMAMAVTIEIFETNPRHLAHYKRLAKEGGPWRSSGHITLPKPSHWRFTRLKPKEEEK